MFVVAIRLYGADEVGEIIGPFETTEKADAWIAANREPTPDNQDPAAWYDVFSLTEPA